MIFAKFGKKSGTNPARGIFVGLGQNSKQCLASVTGNISLLLVNKMREIDDKGCMQALAL